MKSKINLKLTIVFLMGILLQGCSDGFKPVSKDELINNSEINYIKTSNSCE